MGRLIFVAFLARAKGRVQMRMRIKLRMWIWVSTWMRMMASTMKPGSLSCRSGESMRQEKILRVLRKAASYGLEPPSLHINTPSTQSMVCSQRGDLPPASPALAFSLSGISATAVSSVCHLLCRPSRQMRAAKGIFITPPTYQHLACAV